MLTPRRCFFVALRDVVIIVLLCTDLARWNKHHLPLCAKPFLGSPQASTEDEVCVGVLDRWGYTIRTAGPRQHAPNIAIGANTHTHTSRPAPPLLLPSFISVFLFLACCNAATLQHSRFTHGVDFASKETDGSRSGRGTNQGRRRPSKKSGRFWGAAVSSGERESSLVGMALRNKYVWQRVLVWFGLVINQ